MADVRTKLRTALAHWQRRYYEVEAERDEARAEVERLRSAVAGWEHKATVLTTQRDEAVQSRDAAHADLAEERARHAELVAEMQRTRTAHARAETELDAIRTLGEPAAGVLHDLIHTYRARPEVDEHELAALITERVVHPLAAKLRQARAAGTRQNTRVDVEEKDRA